MLIDATWTNLTGAASRPSVNGGDMKNVGIDFSLGWRDRIGQVSYNINGNLSWYKNKVVKYGPDLYMSDVNGRIGNMQLIREGEPIGMFFGYVLDGIYQSKEDVMNYPALPYGVNSKEALETSAMGWVGHYKFKDTNNDGFINAADRQIIGNPHPDLTGGLNIGLQWKEWDLSSYLYFSLGNDLYKGYEFYTLWGSLGSNTFSYDRVENAWHPIENPNGTLPLWTVTNTKPETSESHSGYVEDGSYLRMQTLTLGYSLPKKIVNKIGFSRIRFYGQISNVFTITGYDGLDPEMRSTSDRNKGQDFGGYGMPRQYLFGVNIDF